MNEMKELTDNMKDVLKAIGETAWDHDHNGSVVRALERRGLARTVPFKGLVITQKGYYVWLHLIGEIDDEMLEQCLVGASDD